MLHSLRGGVGASHPTLGVKALLIQPTTVSAYASSSAQKALQALGLRLREIRVDAGITGRGLSAAAGWHESKVSKVEHGRQAPSVADIKAWCAICRAPGLAQELITSVRAVETMFTEWRRMERHGLKQAQESVLPRWERTKRFRAYESWMVPGILQTRAYTRAVLESIAHLRDVPGEVDAAVDVRMQKQNVLHSGVAGPDYVECGLVVVDQLGNGYKPDAYRDRFEVLLKTCPVPRYTVPATARLRCSATWASLTSWSPRGWASRRSL
jgi:transcriptional regulator with XRE-family HTH domain